MIGDVMLDHYILGTASRLSPEAPVPVLLKSTDEFYLGGAGNVFSNVISLGSKCDLLSVIGDDNSGSLVLPLISKKGGDTSSILIDRDRKTTRKTRVIANSHHLVRIDEEDSSDLNPSIELEFINKFESIFLNYDGVILQDYNKGCLTPRIISSVISSCRNNLIPVLVDPKNDNINSYQGATIFKPNLSEFSKISGSSVKTDQDLYTEAEKFRKNMQIELLVVTLSDKGIFYSHEFGSGIKRGFPINVSDVSGAGDSVSAMLILSYLSGESMDNIITLCNITGSIACSKVGAIAVSFFDVVSNENIKHLK